MVRHETWPAWRKTQVILRIVKGEQRPDEDVMRTAERCVRLGKLVWRDGHIDLP